MRRLALAGGLLLLSVPARADWSATGIFQYQDRVFNHSGFTGEAPSLPIRFAVVQVLDASSGDVLASGATDSTGAFSIGVSDAQVRSVRVRALSLSDPSSGYLLRVQDSPDDGAVYAVVGPVVAQHSPASNVAFNGGVPMLAPMFSVGEAFNILDCLENGVDYVVTINGGARPAQLLTANWSTTSTDGTYYSGRNIHLLAEDGYSDTVINHEEGHFMQAMFAHDDTPGGRHYIGDNNQDLRLSMSEGWATYFGLSVRRFKKFSEPIWYVDLMSEAEAPGLNFSYELETPSVSAIGAASEVSVQAVLWDIAVPPSNSPPPAPGDQHIGLPDSVAFGIFRHYFTRLPGGEVTTMEAFKDGWNELEVGHDAELTAVLSREAIDFTPDSEENDDFASRARAVPTNGSPFHHTFYPSGDADWVRFTVQAGQSYVIETTSPVGDCATQLALYGADTTTLLASDVNRAPGDITSRIDFTPTVGGNYYVRASHSPAYGRYGSYDLRISEGTPTRAKFTDVTSAAQLVNDLTSRGVAWGDFDNDGYPDLYVCCTGSDPGAGATNHFYRNTGSGQFAEVTQSTGVGAGTEQHEGAAWGDFDNDGYLDLIVTSLEGIHLFRNNGPPNWDFTDVTSRAGLSGGGSGRTANWVDYDRDGYLDLYVTNYGFPNQLWHNNHDGTFAPVHVGLDYHGYSLSSAFCDFNLDGRPGVALGLDGETDASSLKLFRQGADGQYQDVTESAGLSGYRGRVFGLAWGDFNGDGLPDLAVANESGLNALFRNEGNGTFEEVSRSAGVSGGLGSTSPAWLDADNDGDLDLYMVNYGQPATLFDNLGSNAFTSSGLADLSVNARSVAVADYDRDGSLDICLTSELGDALLKGHAPDGNHWFELHLSGHPSNRAAIGARVNALAGGRWMTREMVGGQAWGAQPDQTLHFGLGSATVLDSLIVHWPSGAVTAGAGIAADRLLALDERDSLVSGNVLPQIAVLRQNAPNPFAGSTRVRFEVPARSARVSLLIYDVEGRLERVLIDGPRAAGANQSVLWDGNLTNGRPAPTGVHFCRLTVGGMTITRKMLLVR